MSQQQLRITSYETGFPARYLSATLKKVLNRRTLV